MSQRQVRLGETIDAIGGPLARLGRSLREDREAVLKVEAEKTSHDLLATDAFLQRFQQVADLTLRKLFPQLLAVLEGADTRVPFAAVLDRLEGYGVLADATWWIDLSETRNRLVHEYAMSTEDRARELAAAWTAAVHLRAEVRRIREDTTLGERIRR